VRCQPPARSPGLWHQETGPTVLATFESGTDYFGSRATDTQDMEGVGRFGWVTDPEGNRIELGQPLP
jgi:hypothetical protein